MASTWFQKKDQRKIAYSMDKNKTEFDFVLIDKSNRRCLNNLKAIPWELQHT